MYGVLYAISPEVFPAKDRGTGNGLTATATRVFGLIVSRPAASVFPLTHWFNTGAGDSALRKFVHSCAGVCFGRAHHSQRSDGSASAIRAAW